MTETAKRSRTQAERRATTRDALLDAAIESLVEDGWAATTTRSVAERAGVSQGAQQHHFRTKAELVHAAITRLVGQLAATALEAPIPQGTERERAAFLLDKLWQIHTLPINGAMYELANLARTDDEVAERVASILKQGTQLTQFAAAHVIPETAEKTGFDDLLLIALSAMRGAVMVSLPGAAGVAPDWPAIRDHLLRSIDALPS